METDTIIRISTPNDADAISEVLRAVFTPFKDGCTEGAFNAITPTADEICGRYGEGPIWVASEGIRIIGTVSTVPEPEWLYIRSMAVSPDKRSTGVGYRLIAAVENYAVENGFERLFLYTSLFLTGAERFYERCGFVRGRDTEPDEWFGTPGWAMEKKIGRNTKQNVAGS
ncbi:MAG: GNAT family N-acetyltransferase [Acidobacteriota bacterium]